MKIVADPNILSSRTGTLHEDVTKEEIIAVLGFEPNVEDDPYKVENSWGFTADGVECAIWDYKGARWSTYGPDAVFEELFPGKYTS